jgi:hypothetical protein
LLTPRQASSRHSSSKLGSCCPLHNSTSPMFHHFAMRLNFVCMADAAGSESQDNAKHIASNRGAMRRCVLVDAK